MKSCFMFGHGDCPESALPGIVAAIEKQYSEIDIRCLYVGNRGSFDRLAATAAKQVKLRHPDLQLYLLLAYHPGERKPDLSDGFDGSYYPPLENVPRPYAIVRANEYMIDTADGIICYVKHIGNTQKLLEYARRREMRKNLPIDNIAPSLLCEEDAGDSTPFKVRVFWGAENDGLSEEERLLQFCDHIEKNPVLSKYYNDPQGEEQ